MLTRLHSTKRLASGVRNASITSNVTFDTIAREWRCKWSVDADKASLTAAQSALEAHTAAIKAVPGVKSVQRIVCGGCQDFKVIVALDAAAYGDFKAKNHGPEEQFLNALKGIKGITNVETQTYTIMPI